jgi:ABC-type transport system involved in multi-copper enzyme maturation permease subunit
MLPHFSDIDWTFIISLILSFVALVFTYDCICGEREQGTLRLMLSGTIPRYEVLLGKYLAAMLTLIIPLLIGLIVSLIIVISSSDVVIGGAAWLKILAIILLSLLYLSVFVLLGVFFSSRVAHSANCMVILLLIWVGLVILVPSLGRIISDVSSECPSRADFERKLHEVVSEIWNNADKYGKNAGSMSHNPNWPKNNPPARARLRTATTNAINQVRDNHHNQLLAQTLTGRSATCFSPVVIYQRASEAITGTGINHCVNLYQQIRQYQAGLKEYIRGEDAHDPNSLHLIFDEEGCARSWKAISHKPVDFATVPKFQERDLALGQSLKLAIWDIGLLALFNLVFFAASYVSFLRYDVR